MHALLPIGAPALAAASASRPLPAIAIGRAMRRAVMTSIQMRALKAAMIPPVAAAELKAALPTRIGRILSVVIPERRRPVPVASPASAPASAPAHALSGAVASRTRSTSARRR